MNIEIFRNDDFTFTGTVLLNGAAQNIIGASMRMTVKRELEDADNVAVFSRATGGSGITLTDAANGIYTVDIVPANTSGLPAWDQDFWYDIQMVLSSKTRTLLRGKLTVKSDVSITSP